MATAAPEIPVLARDQAFEIMYRCYVKDVYHYALALLRNPDDAEDVTQTTFLNAYRAYQGGIEIEKPQNWLIKIAHNVARTKYARASRRVKEVPLENHVEQLALPEVDRPDVTGVLHALGRLPFNQRAALVMRELEGRSYAEIADTIGVSVSAVETLIFRARKSLRLKASALRALALVPLPGSLTRLFESGGAVTGGGAAIGTGFLVKAAVALVAGAVATGVGGDRSGPTAAAAESTPRLPAAQPWHRADGLAASPSSLARHVKSARVVTRHRSNSMRSVPVLTAVPVLTGITHQGSVVGAPTASPRRTGVQAGPPVSAVSSATPATPLADQAAAILAGTVQTVSTAVPAVPVGLPVQVPLVPPVPINLPKVPPGLPAPPGIPLP